MDYFYITYSWESCGRRIVSDCIWKGIACEWIVFAKIQKEDWLTLNMQGLTKHDIASLGATDIDMFP